jgi:hypothetical protein
LGPNLSRIFSTRDRLWPIRFLIRNRAAGRVVIVEEAPAVEVLKKHNTITDDRFCASVVAEHRDIARLKTCGAPCAFVAIEADKFFAKGKLPSFGRRADVYEASGPSTSPGFLGKMAASSYPKQVGQTGKAYTLTPPPGSLLSTQGCKFVIMTVIPWVNQSIAGFSTVDECRVSLIACYTSALDSFYTLRSRSA